MCRRRHSLGQVNRAPTAAIGDLGLTRTAEDSRGPHAQNALGNEAQGPSTIFCCRILPLRSFSLTLNSFSLFYL